jgi:adenylate cyclase
MWINHVYPTANLFATYLGTTVHRYIVEERDKKKVRETFGLYVNPSVVDQMLAHPEMLRLGGEKRELSVLFSDIRGFTSLSEKLPPEELVPQLNHYLTRMTQVVFDHLGTLDKYIGDAVMAIFGAPIPQEDHAVRACSTALHMMAALEELHAEWAERGLPPLHIGIGINTGMMMVGNMGSERRFDYTVLGDNVNLASRLEGLTKMYGVSVVVSEATWLATNGAFVGRELDVVRVKGKQLPVPIFQVMARAEEKEALEGPLASYTEAMDLFKTARWDEAEVLFGKVLDAWPEDTPSTLYLTRCRELREQCPGADWCHVTTLDHK